jgi:uncharacterized membrane protein
MSKSRLEAFSDGVIAIIITIMVLEFRTPEGVDWRALRSLGPIFCTYALSFVYIGIYWNNHHYLIHAATRVTPPVLWANLHLLFWLSLIPFVTSWMGENHSAAVPTAAYGIVGLGSAIAYTILQTRIIAVEGPRSRLAVAVQADVKGKVSLAMYVSAVGLAFVNQWFSDALYVGVALIWLVPDPRIEKRLGSR